jgi:mannitol-1-phosphate 5-dehydrogenase
MYGAGNVGRGFIGKVFHDSGYEVCFLDIDPAVINALNDKKEYTVHIVANDIDRCDTVKNVYAVDANSEQAIRVIADCDIMATAVGVNVLPKIATVLARGISTRIREGKAPLNIILAENQIRADQMMRALIYRELEPCEQVWADESLGLVEASIGRMIPPLAPEVKMKDPVLIAVEPYCELPVDRLGFKGAIPALVGLVPFTPFDFYVKRKLYIHNMGHALCAYLGWKNGYSYIAQAIEDTWIINAVGEAMDHVAQALHNEYPQIPLEGIKANKEDLLLRFRNKALLDTVERVAADPARKLRNSDRLIGAALYCLTRGVSPENIVTGIAFAYNYINPKDASSVDIRRILTEFGIEGALKAVSNIDADSALGSMIIREWRKHEL